MMAYSIVMADLLRRAGRATGAAIRAEDAGDQEQADREFATSRALRDEAARYSRVSGQG